MNKSSVSITATEYAVANGTKNLISVKGEMSLPVMIVPVIVLSIIADMTINYKYQVVDYLTAVIVSSNVFYYTWLHMRFVREHEKGLMMEQRVGMMLTQIKPHFLYNSLGAIEELCDSDPKAAKAATSFLDNFQHCGGESLRFFLPQSLLSRGFLKKILKLDVSILVTPLEISEKI